jgi:UDP-N-acetyl-D-mannosaminuronic acid dehydrogenase
MWDNYLAGEIMDINKVCILGLGYIGLPTACTLAARGVRVIGVDTNPHVVEMLQNGGLHIHEAGLPDLASAALHSGKLTVHAAPEPADAFIIAVPTPFLEHETGEFQGMRYRKADMGAVTSATEAVVPYLRPGNLVVLESTSPPRTTVDLVAPILERSGLRAGVDFYLVYSPERVLPGQILRELVENARVIGGVNPVSAQAGRDLYSIFVQGEIVLTDATTAEMVKLMENTYRDINIAIANEFSRLAERFGVDVWEAISYANRHPRVKVLNPGPGVGGHCISVDPWFFVEAAPELARLIHTARLVNDGQPQRTVDLIRRALGGHPTGKRVAALGLAFKPEVDDLRESPAIEVAQLIAQEGAIVKAYEPFKPGEQVTGIQTVSDLEDCLSDAEALVLLVQHKIFAGLSPKQVAQMTPARIAIDTRGQWDVRAWQAEGFTMYRLGDGHVVRS